jgi:hypothetical protein
MCVVPDVIGIEAGQPFVLCSLKDGAGERCFKELGEKGEYVDTHNNAILPYPIVLFANPTKTVRRLLDENPGMERQSGICQYHFDTIKKGTGYFKSAEFRGNAEGTSGVT